MRIIRSDFDNLVEKFGASRRLATRLAALARHGLFTTETVLEFAAEDDGKPLRELLLSKAMLDGAAAMDAETLRRLSRDAFFREHPLALVTDGAKRVLCLEEEASEAPEAAAPTDTSRSLAVTDSGSLTVIRPDEARRLLGSDEVSRLKLDLVTSSDAGRRLEAVRKLYLSELANDEKLRLFLTALRDRDADVRSEAARALGGLGLDGALTENLAKASRGSTAERVVSITNLGRILPRLEQQQQRLGMALLVEFLTSSEEHDVVLAAIGVLASGIAGLPEMQGMTAGLHKKLIELLQIKLAEFEDSARRLYATIFKHERDEISRLLAVSIEEAGQPALRYFLLSLITEHNLPAAAEPGVIKQLIEGLDAGNELDRNYQACAAALSRLGEKAVTGLLGALGSARDAGKERIVDLLGHLLRGGASAEHAVSGQSAARIARACLDLYSGESAEVQTALLESGFFEHPSLDEASREEAVRAFIDSLHEFRFERQIELVQTALARCGPVAIKPLAEAMKHAGHEITRLSAARLLPEVVAEHAALSVDGAQALIADIRELIDSEDSGFPERGPLYVALGRIGAHPAIPAAQADELAEVLRERVGLSSNVYDILEAMGWLAAGENLSSNQRLESGYLLLNVLKKGLPGMSGRMKKNREGELVLHFGRETTAYTDMIPRILEGLGRMIQAPATPDVLFQAIAGDLMKLWREIVDYKRIWAPAATITLARLLGDIGLGERRDDRMADEIADLLSRKLALMPVMQVLSKLAIVRRDSERMDLIAQRAFNELARRLNEEPAPEITERRQILETMAAISKRARIGEREKDIEHARGVVIEAAFDALRDKMFQARLILEDLAGSEFYSQQMRSSIRRRLTPGPQK